MRNRSSASDESAIRAPSCASALAACTYALARRGGCLIGGGLGVEIAGRGGGACTLDATERAGVEQRLREVRARVERVDRALGAHRRDRRPAVGQAGWESRCRTSPCSACVRSRAPTRKVRHKVGAPLRDARVSLFGAVAGGHDRARSALTPAGRRRRARGNGLRCLGARGREGDWYDERRQRAWRDESLSHAGGVVVLGHCVDD